MFLGSVLYSPEALFNITKKEIEMLQDKDNDLLRKIHNARYMVRH